MNAILATNLAPLPELPGHSRISQNVLHELSCPYRFFIGTIFNPERLLRYAPLGLFILTLSILATNLAPLWGCLGFRGSPKTCYTNCSVTTALIIGTIFIKNAGIQAPEGRKVGSQ